MRRKWIWDPESREMVEVTPETRVEQRAPAVWGDLKPFVSHVNGEYISDRGQLRRHMKNHGVAFADEMKGTSERVRKDRAKREKSERLQSVVDAYHRVRDRRN